MMIQILHAAFVYQAPDGEVEALRDVSLDVEEGEFCSIVGPSGCGTSKSTPLIPQWFHHSQATLPGRIHEMSFMRDGAASL